MLRLSQFGSIKFELYVAAAQINCRLRLKKKSTLTVIIHSCHYHDKYICFLWYYLIADEMNEPYMCQAEYSTKYCYFSLGTKLLAP